MNRYQRLQAARMNQRALALFAELGRTPTVTAVRDWGPLDRKLPGEQLLPKRFPADCGTRSGYEAHRRRGETACAACKEAHARAARKGTGTLMGRNAA